MLTELFQKSILATISDWLHPTAVVATPAKVEAKSFDGLSFLYPVGTWLYLSKEARPYEPFKITSYFDCRLLGPCYFLETETGFRTMPKHLIEDPRRAMPHMAFAPLDRDLSIH